MTTVTENASVLRSNAIDARDFRKTLNINYDVLPIQAIKASVVENEKTGKRTIGHVELDGRGVHATDRFWVSLFARYGFGKNMFNYFDPVEVFERISERRVDDRIRFCVQENEKGQASLLAVSNPVKPAFEFDEVYSLFDENRESSTDLAYADGIISADFTPRGETPFEISGDKFMPKFVLNVPIDGYGSPESVVAALRLVCTNGSVALSKVFSNKIPGGSDMTGGLNRIKQVITGFGNDEGYDAYRRRLVAATESYCSVGEMIDANQVLVKVLGADGLRREGVSEAFGAFDRLAGSPLTSYGLISNTTISKKRLKTYPTRARVFDLINFCTEIATHHLGTQEQRLVHAFIGGLIANEYDLEGSAANGKDFIDLFAQAGAGGAISDVERMLSDESDPELN